MGNVVIQPGAGGRYTSEAISSATTSADNLDVRHLSGFNVAQVLATAASNYSGTWQIEQTFDGTNWNNLGGPLNPDGLPTRFEAESRPFGKIRFNLSGLSGISTTNTMTLVVEGAPAFNNF